MTSYRLIGRLQSDLAKKYYYELRRISMMLPGDTLDMTDIMANLLISGSLAKVNVYGATMRVEAIEESPKYDVRVLAPSAIESFTEYTNDIYAQQEY